MVALVASACSCDASKLDAMESSYERNAWAELAQHQGGNQQSDMIQYFYVRCDNLQTGIIKIESKADIWANDRILSCKHASIDIRKINLHNIIYI
jgi:hypothetical protein